MEKIFELFYDAVDKGEYKKTFNLTLLIFVLLAPSISVIFLYKREWFIEIDFITILLIAIITNILLFICVYFTNVTFSADKRNLESYKNINNLQKINIEIKGFTEKLQKFTTEIDNINKCNSDYDAEEVKKKIELYQNKIKDFLREEKNINKNIDLNNEINTTKEIITSTITFICLITGFVWVNYFFDILKGTSTTPTDIIMKLFVISSVILFICIIKKLFSLKKYVKEMKVIYKEVEEKEYKWYKDSSLLLQIVYILFVVSTIRGFFDMK